jgi:hypothetical protein
MWCCVLLAKIEVRVDAGVVYWLVNAADAS